MKVEHRARRSWPAVESVSQDLRFGLRTLLKSPGFTAVALLSLALGIGINTAIFTLINAVILKPLPVKEPAQLVLFADVPNEGTSLGDPPTGRWELFSYPAYEYFRDHDQSFQDLCAFRSGEARLSVRVEGRAEGEGAERAQGHLVSGNYFSVLGVNAAAGRTLTPEDDSPAAHPVAVISHGYWRSEWNSDPGVIGRVVLLNETAFTIVGVMRPDFFGTRVRRSPDFWLPLAFQPQVELEDSRLANKDAYWLNLMGRLRPGVELQQAQAAVNTSLDQFLTEQAGAQLTDERRRAIQASHIRLTPGGRGISGLRFYYSEPLNILMATVALILLIACANVGNLLLSKSVSRQKEVLVRLALGASRARLVRQLLTESLLLAVIGGLLGALLSMWGARLLVAMVAPEAPLDIRPDMTIFGFTAGVALLSGILFGLAPALRASRVDISSGLKERSPRRGAIRSRFGLAPTLVVSQVALSLVLLVGAGLFARSLMELESEDLGFNPSNILLVGIDARLAGYKPAELPQLYRQLLERVGGLPGVVSASVASFSPMSGNNRTSNVSVHGYTPDADENMIISHLLVGPRYAETLGLPVMMGRELGPQDSAAAPGVAMVSKAFADYFFKDQNPIGRRFNFGSTVNPEGAIEIVGVIGDAKYADAKQEPVRVAYLPILQAQNRSAYLATLEIRTAGDPLSAGPAVRSAVAQVDGKLSVLGVNSLSKQIERSFLQQRLMAQLVSIFGLLALVLACVGLYGVMAHSVARRTNEIAIRMALGAERGRVVWMIMREALTQVVLGIALGVMIALATTRLISSMLHGVSTTDPVTIAVAVLTLVLTACLAGYLPARQAAKGDPMIALRYE